MDANSVVAKIRVGEMYWIRVDNTAFIVTVLYPWPERVDCWLCEDCGGNQLIYTTEQLRAFIP